MRLPWLGLRGVALALVCLVSAGAGIYLLGRGDEPREVRASLSVAEALAPERDSGFLRATEPRPFAFPRDHGPHPGYATEWWYYTGNLQAEDGRHFGFQLTFFRKALTSKPVKRSSAWAASDVYMAHFAVADVAARRFHAFERLARAALGLAGARAHPFRVWLEDWSAEASGPARASAGGWLSSPDRPTPTEGRGDEAPGLRLHAAAGGVAVDLTLRSAKSLVLQGERGLSRKGPEPGNASYYYSLTRLEARGVVTVGSAAHRVTGSGWMDREWGTTALGTELVGWDWFALQLADGRDVMVYRLRRRDGGTDPFSRGTLVAADGSTRALAREAVGIEVLGTWRSPRTGTVYPSRWRLRVPGEDLTLDVTPELPDQELDLTVRYWEGAARVTGTAAGQPVNGHGYVELTGYGDGR